jgi:hypothetical protein
VRRCVSALIVIYSLCLAFVPGGIGEEIADREVDQSRLEAMYNRSGALLVIECTKAGEVGNQIDKVEVTRAIRFALDL